MTVRSRVIDLVGRIFKNVSAVVKNDLNLKAIKRQFNADGSTPVMIEIYEDRALTRIVHRSTYKVGDVTVVPVPDEQADAVVKMDYDTLIYLLKGEIVRRSPKDGTPYTQPYEFMDAYMDGSIRIYRKHEGQEMQRYMADILLFQELYKMVSPKLRQLMGVK